MRRGGVAVSVKTLVATLANQEARDGGRTRLSASRALACPARSSRTAAMTHHNTGRHGTSSPPRHSLNPTRAPRFYLYIQQTFFFHITAAQLPPRESVHTYSRHGAVQVLGARALL